VISDNYFQSLIENTSDIIAVVDRNGILTYVSPSVEKVLGYEPEEMIGKEFVSFLYPRDADPIIRKFGSMLTEITFIELGDFRAITKDGNVRIFIGKGKRITNDKGEIQIVANATDITVMRRTENELKESLERYKLITETSQDSIYVLDLDGTLQYINPHGASLFGKRPEELIGKKWETLFPTFAGAKQKVSIGRVIREKIPIIVEEEARFPVGNMWINTWLIPVIIDNKEVRSIFGVSRDITAKKEAEIELQDRSLTAEEAKIKAQTYFDYLAHDIANLVSPIMNYSEAIIEMGNVPPEAANYAGKIISQIKEIATFLFNLRLLAEAEKVPIEEAESLDLADTIRDIVKSIEERYTDRKFRIHLEIPKDKSVKVIGGKHLRNSLVLEFDRAAQFAKNRDIDIHFRIVPIKDESDLDLWQIRLDIPNYSIPSRIRESFSIPFNPDRRKVPYHSTRNLSFLASIAEHFGGHIWFEDLDETDPSKGSAMVINLLRTFR